MAQAGDLDNLTRPLSGPFRKSTMLRKVRQTPLRQPPIEAAMYGTFLRGWITFVLTGAAVFATLLPSAASAQAIVEIPELEARFAVLDAPDAGASPDEVVRYLVGTRIANDLGAMSAFRPGFTFWSHVFTIPDGSIAFGSETDGRLLAVFPAAGNWDGRVQWEDPSLASFMSGTRLSSTLSQRREEIAMRLEMGAGPIKHNPTRGNFLLPKARRYGSFLDEWSAIYERFGVPAEIGLAQAAVESGWDGRIRSEAGALGFCQWMPANWNAIKKLAHTVVEGYNQTTQAPYCAAYLTILAAKYGSFIPALSEHHAGGTNVVRTVINGERLGGTNIRESYFLGSRFQLDLREIAPRRYQDLYGTYGPRSFSYSEMIFGNTINVIRLRESTPQEQIYAIRTSRVLSIAEIRRRTGLSEDELRRFNPALVNQVPRGASLYLPMPVPEFGTDVSFWHDPTPSEFASALRDFLEINAPLESWEDPAFASVLRDFQRRFAATGSEEGRIMGTMIAYLIEESFQSGRTRILSTFRSDPEILQLFDEGVAEREASVSRIAALETAVTDGVR